MKEEPRFGIYIISVAIGAAAVLAGIFAFNSVVDPTADFLFLTGLNAHSIYRIDNYTDAKFKRGLIRGLPRDGVDAAVFGSSRALRIDPESPGFKELGKKTFNLAIQGSRFASIEEFIKIVRKKNPNAICVVALDFFAFSRDKNKPMMYLNDANPFPAYRDAILRLIDIRTLQESIQKSPESPRHRLLLNGGDVMVRNQEEIEKLPAYLQGFSQKTLKEMGTYDEFIYDTDRMNQLRRLRAENPGTLFFINPESRWYMEPIRKSPLWPIYQQWKADLAELGDVVDFSDAPEITDNMNLYFDEHHYLAEAGAMIMEDVANARAGRQLRYGKILGSQPR